MRTYIVLDIETTGISPEIEAITEIGAAKIVNGNIAETFSSLVNPNRPIPAKITALTGITDEMVAEALPIEDVMPSFIEFCEALPILGHNVNFDYSFLKTAASRLGLNFEKTGLDTLVLSRQFLEKQKSYSLTNLIEVFGLSRENAHRGLDDALATWQIYENIYANHYKEETSKVFVPKPFFYKPKKQSPITDKQKRFLSDLLHRYKVEPDYVIEDLSKSEASRKIDQILHTYGRRE